MAKKLQLLLVGVALCFGTVGIVGCSGSKTEKPADSEIVAPPADEPTGQETAPPPPPPPE